MSVPPHNEGFQLMAKMSHFFCTDSNTGYYRPLKLILILLIFILFITHFYASYHYYNDYNFKRVASVDSRGEKTDTKNNSIVHPINPASMNSTAQSLQEIIQAVEKNTLKILLWVAPKSKVTRSHFWEVNELERGGECPGKCQVLEDRNMVDIADAIVCHGNPESGKDLSLPPQKKGNQLRIFFRMEPPTAALSLPNQFIYNWTFTYRTDSDVPIYYGHYIPKKNAPPLSTNEVISMATHSTKIGPQKLAQLSLFYLAGKTKMVAWIVTNCQTKGKRENLVEKLQKFLTVDVYGACGHLNCSLVVKDGWNQDGCHWAVGTEYKFYLAFENNWCTDYVTEKLFRSLRFGMVPIVYGAANYNFHAPPGSFIDAMAFSSVAELADYLKFLDENPQEYLKYFLWTQYYHVPETMAVHRWCKLCDKLWEHSIVDERGQRVIDPLYHRSYPDILSWFNHEPFSDTGDPKVAACRPPPNFH